MKFGIYGIKSFVVNEGFSTKTFDEVCNKLIHSIDKYDNDAENILRNYLNKNNEQAGRLYQDALDRVHKLKYDSKKVDNDALAEALSKALVYRCESYISSSTI